MLYMSINRTRKGLSSEDYEQLGNLARAFYSNIPEGLTIRGDWTATDGSCSFALLETDDPALLERVQAPFRRYVDIEMLPVQAASGWK